MMKKSPRNGAKGAQGARQRPKSPTPSEDANPKRPKPAPNAAATPKPRPAKKPPPQQAVAKKIHAIAEGDAMAEGDATAEGDDGLVRLNVFLQENGIASRRKADTMIEQGRVQVDGIVVKKLGTRVRPDATVKVDGKIVRTLSAKKVVLMLNKPDLCITSRSDTQGRRTIFDLPDLHRVPAGCQAVGRLDYRSEGLMLVTNDGDLAYALTHPRFAVEKTYAVLVSDTVNAEDIDRLRKGVKLDDGFAKPIAVRLGNKERLGTSRGQWIEIIVGEGRNRLIRRMMEVLGLKVVRLVRLAIGDLHLPEKLGSGHVSTVVGTELAYLNRIKLDMLEERDSPNAPKSPTLTAGEKMRRKLKRKLALNDIEYEEEKARRSAEAGAKRRARKSEHAEGRTEAAEAPPDTRAPAPAKRSPAPTTRAPAPASGNRSGAPSRKPLRSKATPSRKPKSP
jgi:pseudouridine synthase